MAEAALSAYYDRLTKWNAVARVFGHDGGRSSLTVHRALVDPRAGGRPTTTRLHDILFSSVSTNRPLRLLDAGCGLGGTMLQAVKTLNATATGLTLSRVQAAAAEAAAARMGLSSRVDVLVQTYDHPPPGPFDLVVAIESIAHSADPWRSVSALARVLAPGGTIAIVDDMPEVAAQGTADLARFKAGWACPVLWDRRAYVDAFERLGLHLLVDRDLSGDCRPRTIERISLLEQLNRVVHVTVPSHRWRAVLDTHYGGLALERLTRAGLMRYRMILAGSGL